MDRPLEGAVVIGTVGDRWVVAHVAAGLQQGEATGQVVVVGGGGRALYGGSWREPL